MEGSHSLTKGKHDILTDKEGIYRTPRVSLYTSFISSSEGDTVCAEFHVKTGGPENFEGENNTNPKKIRINVTKIMEKILRNGCPRSKGIIVDIEKNEKGKKARRQQAGREVGRRPRGSTLKDQANHPACRLPP
jgi:hypothetical protein